MRIEINSKSDLDDVIKYFDGFSVPNAWHCPDTDRIIDVQTCLECYQDALDNRETDPDDMCLCCNLSRRAIAWEQNRKRTKKQSTPDFDISDPVNHPGHYCSHPSGVECIEITRHHDFCTGNAIKYVWRHGLKGGSKEKKIEDLKKAIKYLEFAVDVEMRGNADA